VTRQPVIYDDDQRFNITPPSTSRHQHRSTSSANNTYRHLPGIYYDYIYNHLHPPSTPLTLSRITSHSLSDYISLSLGLHLTLSRITSHSLSDYISHSLGILSFGLHRRGLFTMDYRTSTSPWINSIGLPLRSWTTNSII